MLETSGQAASAGPATESPSARREREKIAAQRRYRALLDKRKQPELRSKAHAVDVATDPWVDWPIRPHAPYANGDVVVDAVIITPILAKQLLARAGTQPGGFTRAPIDRFVDAYATSMGAERWIFNGMPLIWGQSGRLLDGTMRLKACVKADTAFPTLIVRGVPDDILHTIDQHRRRSFLQVLNTRKVAEAPTILRALTRLLRYDDKTLEAPYKHISWVRLDAYLKANRKDLEAAMATVERVGKTGQGRPPYISAGLATTLAFMGAKVDQVATERFLGAVFRPDAFEASEPGHAIARRLEFEQLAKAKVPASEIFALCLKGLQDSIDGESASKYRYNSKARGGGPRAEDFPTLRGYKGLQTPANATKAEGYGLLPGVADVEAPARSQFKGIRYEIQEITPAFAADVLARRNKGNRDQVQSAVDMIARDIRAGRWLFNATPICFSNGEDNEDEQGRPLPNLLNGQHRMQACSNTDIPIDCLVVSGIDPAAAHTYDVQVKRHVFIHGLSDDPAPDDPTRASDMRVLIAAAKLVWHDENKSLGTKARATPSEIEEVLRRHPLLHAQVVFGRRASFLAPASLLTYFAYRVIRRGGAKGSEFLSKLETGAELKAGSPLLALRQRLIKMRRGDTGARGTARDSRTDVLQVLLDGWNKHLKSLGEAGEGKGSKSAVEARRR